MGKMMIATMFAAAGLCVGYMGGFSLGRHASDEELRAAEGVEQMQTQIQTHQSEKIDRLKIETRKLRAMTQPTTALAG